MTRPEMMSSSHAQRWYHQQGSNIDEAYFHDEAMNVSESVRIGGPRPWIDITEGHYGAYRDGTSPDRTYGAVQRAFDQAQAAAYGARIYAPGGLYALDQLPTYTDTLVESNSGGRTIEFFGDGWGSKFRPKVAFADATLLRFLLTTNTHLRVHDLELQTWSAAGGVSITTLCALQIENKDNASPAYSVDQGSLDRVRITGLAESGVPLLRVGTTEHFVIRDCKIQGHYALATDLLPVGIGIETMGVNNPTQLMLFNTKVIGFEYGLKNHADHLNMSRLSLIGNTSLSDCLNGLYLAGIAVTALEVNGVRFEMTGISMATTPTCRLIYLDGGPIIAVEITSNHFTGMDGANTVAIDLFDNVKGILIGRNSFKTRTTPGDNTCHALKLGTNIAQLELAGNRNHTNALVHTDIPGAAGVVLFDDFTKDQKSLDVVDNTPRTLIDTTVTSGDHGQVINFDVSSLQGWRALEIEGEIRSDKAAVVSDAFAMRLSATGVAGFQVGSGYDYLYHSVISGTPVGTIGYKESLNDTFVDLGLCTAVTAPSGAFTPFKIWLTNYSGTTNQKAISWTVGGKTSVVTAGLRQYDGHAWWRELTPIKGIQLLVSAGVNVDIYSRATVRGIP